MSIVSDYFIDNNTSNYFEDAQHFNASAMSHFMNALVLANHVNKDTVSGSEMASRKQGDTVNIRMPFYPLSGDGQDISNTKNKIIQRTIPFRLEYWKHVAFELSGLDRAITVKQFEKDVLKPGVKKLASDVENSIAQLGKKIPFNTGTAGDPLDSFADISAVQKIMDKIGVPEDRTLICDIDSSYDLAESFITNSAVVDLVRKAIVKGYIAEVSDLTIVKSQNIVKHTPGGTQTAVTVNTTLTKDSVQNSSDKNTTVISLTGLDATPAVGDVFTIADVYVVHPWTKEVLNKLQDFVVISTNTGGTASITINPRIVLADDDSDGWGGGRRNVSQYPQAGAAVTFENTAHQCNIALHPDAIALAMVPVIPPPSFKPWSNVMQHEGLSLTVTRGGDINTFTDTIRIDALWGVDLVYPEFAVRAKG